MSNEPNLKNEKSPDFYGLPKSILEKIKGYHPTKNPITDAKEVTAQNCYRIVQNEGDAWDLWRKGVVPKDKTPNGKRKIYVNASSLADYLGLKLKPATNLFGTKYYPDSLNQFKTKVSQVRQVIEGFQLEWGHFHETNAIHSLIKSSKIPIDVFQFGCAERKINPEHYSKDLKYDFEFDTSNDDFEIIIKASPDGIFTHKRATDENFNQLNGIVEAKARTTHMTTSSGTFKIRGEVRPFETVPEIYIAQMYAQMFTVDKFYGYFISWSLTNGSNVMLLERDEEYMRLMFFIIKFVIKKYIIGKATINDNPFSDISHVYSKFLRKTQEVCNKENYIDMWHSRNYENDIFFPRFSTDTKKRKSTEEESCAKKIKE